MTYTINRMISGASIDDVDARASSVGEQPEWSAEGLFARLAIKPPKA